MVFMDTKDWRDDQGRAAIEETIRQAKARRVDYLRENVWPPLGTTSGSSCSLPPPPCCLRDRNRGRAGVDVPGRPDFRAFLNQTLERIRPCPPRFLTIYCCPSTVRMTRRERPHATRIRPGGGPEPKRWQHWESTVLSLCSRTTSPSPAMRKESPHGCRELRQCPHSRFHPRRCDAVGAPQVGYQFNLRPFPGRAEDDTPPPSPPRDRNICAPPGGPRSAGREAKQKAVKPVSGAAKKTAIELPRFILR